MDRSVHAENLWDDISMFPKIQVKTMIQKCSVESKGISTLNHLWDDELQRTSRSPLLAVRLQSAVWRAAGPTDTLTLTDWVCLCEAVACSLWCCYSGLIVGPDIWATGPDMNEPLKKIKKRETLFCSLLCRSFPLHVHPSGCLGL